MRPGVVYQFTCQTCVSEGREDKQVGRYVGESARTLYDMCREHVAALRTLNKEPLCGAPPEGAQEPGHPLLKPQGCEVLQGQLDSPSHRGCPYPGD